MKTVRNFAMIISIALLVLVSGCAEPQPAGLSNDQVAAVTDNLLQALNTGDYQQFTRDFGPEMLNAFPQESFQEMRDLLQETSGDYVSLGKLTLVNQGGYAAYLYQCEFEKELVIVRVVFAIGGDKVDGLFFDSTNMRAASK